MLDTCALWCDNQEKDYTHALIQELFPGGWGVQARLPENSLDNVFFYLVLNLFAEGDPMVLVHRKLNFSEDPEGVHHLYHLWIHTWYPETKFPNTFSFWY